ncbi:hypothetical protein X946_3501 [Burkholderia sp. ABCPW 111]|nr:hypothetical protein X946_3501 [Burkholderia sp. ABCPW 111]
MKRCATVGVVDAAQVPVRTAMHYRKTGKLRNEIDDGEGLKMLRLSILCRAVGGWRLAAGGWRLAVGGWRLAAFGFRLSAFGFRLSAFGFRLSEDYVKRFTRCPNEAALFRHIPTQRNDSHVHRRPDRHRHVRRATSWHTPARRARRKPVKPRARTSSVGHPASAARARSTTRRASRIENRKSKIESTIIAPSPARAASRARAH